MAVSGGYDGTVRVWDLDGGASVTIRLNSAVRGCTVTLDGAIVVATHAGLVALDVGDDVRHQRSFGVGGGRDKR